MLPLANANSQGHRALPSCGRLRGRACAASAQQSNKYLPQPPMPTSHVVKRHHGAQERIADCNDAQQLSVNATAAGDAKYDVDCANSCLESNQLGPSLENPIHSMVVDRPCQLCRVCKQMDCNVRSTASACGIRLRSKPSLGAVVQRVEPVSNLKPRQSYMIDKHGPINGPMKSKRLVIPRAAEVRPDHL